MPLDRESISLLYINLILVIEILDIISKIFSVFYSSCAIYHNQNTQYSQTKTMYQTCYNSTSTFYTLLLATYALMLKTKVTTTRQEFTRQHTDVCIHVHIIQKGRNNFTAVGNKVCWNSKVIATQVINILYVANCQRGTAKVATF